MPRWPERIPWKEYIRLYYLETTLRWLIRKHLDKIPPDTEKEAKGRKQHQREMEKEVKVPTTRCEELIWYIDFPDEYIKIIKSKWFVFEPIFKFKGIIIDGLKRLEPLRHNVAHMRPLTSEQIEEFGVTSRRLLRHIWDYINERYVNQAWELMQNERYEEAEKTLLKGLKETKNELLHDRGDPWIAQNLGKLYKEWGKPEKAKKWFEYAEKHLALPTYKALARDVEEASVRFELR